MIKRVCNIAVAISTFSFGLASPKIALSQALQNENLLVIVPRGFVIAKTGDQGETTISEYVPESETTSNWSRMVTVQVFHNLKNVDPEKFALGMKSRWLGSCGGSSVDKVKDITENGYPVSLWLSVCPNNIQTQKPETMFAKYISGNDSFYSVQYAYRTVLTKEIIPPAMTYLGSVKACDTRLAGRECPVVPPSGAPKRPA